MKSSWTVLSLTAAAAIAMGVLYARFVWVIANEYLVPFTLLELLVFSTMLLRVGAFFLVPRLRHASASLVFDVLAVEVLLVPILIPLYLVTGSGFYSALWDQLFVAWVFALLVIGPSLMLFRLTKALLEGGKLLVLLPSSAAMFAVLWSLQGISPASGGSAGPNSLIESYLGGISQGGVTTIASPVLAAAGIVCFIAIGLYAATTNGRQGSLRSRPLLVCLLGIVVALAWVAAFSTLTANSVLSLSVPTTAIGGVLWWVTREK